MPLTNVTALGCSCILSCLAAETRGSRGLALSLVGAAASTVDGHTGGHLSFVRDVNVNPNAWREGFEEWTTVLDDADLT